jgi:hypothetical protein
MNEGVLISINDEIYNDDWMQYLIEGIPQRYDTKRILVSSQPYNVVNYLMYVLHNQL